MYNEKADSINKLLDGLDNRIWSGNLAARSNNNSDKEKNPTNDNTTAPKKPTNPSRQVPVHSSGPLTITAATATSFPRSSSSSSRRAPVNRSGPLNRTNTTTATGTRLFGESSSSSPRPVQMNSSSGPLNLQAAATPAGPPKLVRCGGMRRDWSFEDLRQMNSLKT